MRQLIWTAISVAVLAGTAGRADTEPEISDNRVSVKSAWSVFVEEDPKECWVVSAPQSWTASRGGQNVTSSVTRGEIGMFVTFRPGSGVAGEVSFTGGYPFREGSTVTVEVRDTSYTLFVDGEWAWPAPADDGKLLTDMKAGVDAVVTGISSRGTTTRDTFSLIGITAAVDEAASRCSAP